MVVASCFVPPTSSVRPLHQQSSHVRRWTVPVNHFCLPGTPYLKARCCAPRYSGIRLKGPPDSLTSLYNTDYLDTCFSWMTLIPSHCMKYSTPEEDVPEDIPRSVPPERCPRRSSIVAFRPFSCQPRTVQMCDHTSSTKMQY